MWCKSCNRETEQQKCELCGNLTETDIPIEIYWCDHCKVPIIKYANSIDKSVCPACHQDISYLCADLRPVFPEEQLLLEVMTGKPLAHLTSSVWALNNRYYINGKPIVISTSFYRKLSPAVISEQLECYKSRNDYTCFNEYILVFIGANKDCLDYIRDEAFSFIKEAAATYPSENVVISFSGARIQL